MKPNAPLSHVLRRTVASGVALMFAAQTAAAATADLAGMPLANATTVDILPNLFFVLDDSTSMEWDYMPDYVDDNDFRYGSSSSTEGGYCRDNYTEDSNTDKYPDKCYFGDPPYMVSSFNGLAYNPAVTYSPPVNADGSVKAGHNGWLASSGTFTDVPQDGYGILTTAVTNLTTAFPERQWCDNNSSSTCNNASRRKAAIDTATGTYKYPNGNDGSGTIYKYLKTIYGAPYYYTATVQWCNNKNNSGADENFGTGTCQSKKTSTYKYVKYSNWTRVDITAATTFPAKATTRTDCAGAACTYAEEMANFANWYAWYRTRIQTMKTSVSLAFKDVRGTPNAADATDKNYFHARIGFTTINDQGTTDGNTYLPIANFDGSSSTTQKGKFYTRLFATDCSPGGSTNFTPLRGALAKAGKIYAGVKGADPIQYSCQRNFTILSTDGYWNSYSEVDGSTSTSYGPDKLDNNDVSDMDGSSGSPNACNANQVIPKCADDGSCDAKATQPECDKLKKSNTLADVAYYYYHTDLRPRNADGTCARPNCEDNVKPSGTNIRVDDVATWQHMTTFTIGLGVDGTLAYQDGYKTSTSGDYYDIKQGTKNWPDPTDASDEERIDDLWHAAVNGRGTYFSARDPSSLVDGLRSALGALESSSGSGAAAATSNLQPVSGDNFIYIANYRTVHWDGDISAYTIDLSTGAVSSSATWQAASLLDGRVTGTCGDTESRVIYTGGANNLDTLRLFQWANLTATEKAFLDNTKLSQYTSWPSSQQSFATGDILLRFLRGQNRYEDQDRDSSFVTNCAPYHRLYRDRDHVLGDIVHSQPIYVKQPFYSYTDSGYTAFKSTGRSANLYVAANDGMLHAFDPTTGQERWAYVPPMVLKDLYHLAETDYSTNHRFFVDGPISVSDIKTASGWKTILVGGLGKGGRGYYALDITNPAMPAALWTFSTDNDANLGYTYGTPLITKLGNGTWAVVVASGYNNVPEGSDYAAADGQGRVYVLNAATGAVIRTINTGAGDTSTPSGLAQINIKVIDFQTDNTAVQAYGGDLLGNLWRFDLDAGTSSKVAALGATQPITAAPEIGDVDGHTVLYFGTGRYLGQADLSLTDTQAIYGIKDDGSTTVDSPASQLVQQVLTGGNSRTITSNPVDWSSKFGWYINLNVESKERVHLPAQLFFGTLVVSSVVPAATACEPGGHSFLYLLSYRSGGAYDGSTSTVVGSYYTSPIVGVTVAKLPTGTPKIYPITADGAKPTGEPPTLPIGASGASPAGGGRRVMWRELMEQ